MCAIFRCRYHAKQMSWLCLEALRFKGASIKEDQTVMWNNSWNVKILWIYLRAWLALDVSPREIPSCHNELLYLPLEWRNKLELYNIIILWVEMSNAPFLVLFFIQSMRSFHRILFEAVINILWAIGTERSCSYCSFPLWRVQIHCNDRSFLFP